MGLKPVDIEYRERVITLKKVGLTGLLYICRDSKPGNDITFRAVYIRKINIMVTKIMCVSYIGKQVPNQDNC